MTLLLVAVVVVAIGAVLVHELGVMERASRSSTDLHERQRRARMEADR